MLLNGIANLSGAITSVQNDIDRELRLSEFREQMQQEMKRIQELEQKMQAQMNELQQQSILAAEQQNKQRHRIIKISPILLLASLS